MTVSVGRQRGPYRRRRNPIYRFADPSVFNPENWNDLLTMKIDTTLFTFAQLFADSFRQAASYRSLRTASDVRKSRKEWEAIGTSLMRSLRKIYAKVFSDEEIISVTGLDRFFRFYKDRLMVLKSEDLSSWRGLGPGLGVRSLIAVQWGTVMKRSGAKSDWVLLSELYQWFWGKIQGIAAYKEANPLPRAESDLTTFMKVQYSRYRDNQSIVANLDVRSIPGITFLTRDYCSAKPIEETVMYGLLGRADTQTMTPENAARKSAIEIYRELGYDVKAWAKASRRWVRARRSSYLDGDKGRPALEDPRAICEQLPPLPPLIIFPDGSYFLSKPRR